MKRVRRWRTVRRMLEKNEWHLVGPITDDLVGQVSSPQPPKIRSPLIESIKKSIFGEVESIKVNFIWVVVDGTGTLFVLTKRISVAMWSKSREHSSLFSTD